MQERKRKSKEKKEGKYRLGNRQEGTRLLEKVSLGGICGKDVRSTFRNRALAKRRRAELLERNCQTGR